MNLLNKNLAEMKILVVFALCSWGFVAYPQEGSAITSLAKDSALLVNLHDKTKAKDSLIYQKKFVEEFPPSFKNFEALYGFSDKTGKSPLYDHVDHVFDFCRFLNPSDKKHLEKIIRLCFFGVWDADAISVLGNCAYEKVLANPLGSIDVLKTFQEIEIRSFWRFLFDGPHPDNPLVKKEFDELYKEIKQIDSKMAGLMKIEYDRLIREMDHHGH